MRNFIVGDPVLPPLANSAANRLKLCFNRISQAVMKNNIVFLATAMIIVRDRFGYKRNLRYIYVSGSNINSIKNCVKFIKLKEEKVIMPFFLIYIG